MTKITIEAQEEDQALIESLLKRLNIATRIEEKPVHTRNGEKVVAAMQAIANSESFSFIKDPVAWQREVRQDPTLPFQDR